MKRRKTHYALALALALLLCIALPMPAHAAPQPPFALPYTLGSGSIHVDLHNEDVRALVEQNPFAVASYLRAAYLAAGHTDFNIPLWQFALELGGHAIVVRIAPADDEMYQRAIVADCGVDALDEDAELVIAMANFYYGMDERMSEILFGL